MSVLDGIPMWSGVKGYVLGAAAAAALCLPLAYCTGRDHGKSAEQAAQAAAERKARAVQAKSEGVAAKERETETKGVADRQAERDKEIRNAGEDDRKPSAGRNALNCDRMRKAGTDTRNLPGCGGR